MNIPAMLKDWNKRQEYVKTVAWAIPSDKAIKEICDFAKEGMILEIGAGLGYWSSLLLASGAKVVATDVKDPGWQHNQNTPYMEIIEASNQKAIELFPCADVLFLCWPPYNQPMAYDALSSFKGGKLAYVGETEEGCCASNKFFDELRINWTEEKCIEIPQWWGLHDALFLYKRREIKPLSRSIEF